MRPSCLFAAAALLALHGGAHAEPSSFDGRWRVTMTCPPHDDDDDDAKGYRHELLGEVVAGQLSATHGTEGQPGWHLLKGKILPNGDAALRLEGIVNNTRYAINDAPRGKKYSYRVKAHFAGNEGSGQRLTGRVCEFRFAK